MAKPYLTQPAGRSPDAPPRLWFHELTYQAESWDRARRVVLVVRERPGELYPDHFWLLTSLSRKRYEAQELLAQYRGGKAEGHILVLPDDLEDENVKALKRRMSEDDIIRVQYLPVWRRSPVWYRREETSGEIPDDPNYVFREARGFTDRDQEQPVATVDVPSGCPAPPSPPRRPARTRSR